MVSSESSFSSAAIFLLGSSNTHSLVFNRYRQLIENCFDQGEFLSFETTPELLSCFESDAQHIHTKLPLLVFKPHRKEAIAPFVRACYQLNLPITVRCGGTGYSGGAVASSEGIILLIGHLNEIIAYDPIKGTLLVEPGVTIKQINQLVQPDGWIFPLHMESNGAAGIAACLSINARGYMQQESAIDNLVKDVLLVDGIGEVISVPPNLVCGAEGLWGIIIQLNIKLKRLPEQTVDFIAETTWDEIYLHLPLLRKYQALTSLSFNNGCFCLSLEGEKWRIASAMKNLMGLFPSLSTPDPHSLKRIRHFAPSCKIFCMISSAFQCCILKEAFQQCFEMALDFGLICAIQVDILAGSMQVLLTGGENCYEFSKKMEAFTVLWIDFVLAKGGIIGNCHGVGIQLAPFMTPFFSEETRRDWHKFQTAFDPKGLFSKGRFFPPPGKSLEKVVHAADL